MWNKYAGLQDFTYFSLLENAVNVVSCFLNIHDDEGRYSTMLNITFNYILPLYCTKSFLLSISLENVNKFSVFCGFVHLLKEYLTENFIF